MKKETRAKYTRDARPPFKCRDCDYMHKNMNGLAMHWNRKHGNTNPNREREPHAQNGSHEEERPKMGRPKGVKDSAPRKGKHTLETGGVNFCPSCGCNLAAVRLALTF
jgi:hypothetical protein